MKKISFFITTVVVLFSGLVVSAQNCSWDNTVTFSDKDSILIYYGWKNSDFITNSKTLLFKSYYKSICVDTLKKIVKLQTVQVYSKDGTKNYTVIGLGFKKPVVVSQSNFLIDIKNKRIAKTDVTAVYKDDSFVTVFHLNFNSIEEIDNKYWDNDVSMGNPLYGYFEFAKELLNNY